MKITADNLEVAAARAYTNNSCMSTEEFLEDLSLHTTIRRLAKKISKGNSKNLRLLTNHIICFTNNFDINFSKQVILMNSSEKEKKVLQAVLLYLGFLSRDEYATNMLDFETIKLLKELD